MTVIASRSSLAIVKTLLMFAMFAMTTDSVGVIIPEVIRTLRLSLTAAGTFQYATMTGIAVAGLLLGSLADRFGRRRTVIVGLGLFAAACFLLSAGNTLWFFAVLLTLSGLAIGIFKTGALALIGDVSRSTGEHTAIMNTLEGFFGLGAIVGPALLTRLLAAGFSWKWLYVIAGGLCVVLVVLALLVRYPETPRHAASASLSGTGAALRNRACWRFRPARFSTSPSRPQSTCGCRRCSRTIPAARPRSPPIASRSSFLPAPPGASWRLDAEAGELATGSDGVQRRHPGVLAFTGHRRRHVGCSCCRFWVVRRR